MSDSFFLAGGRRSGGGSTAGRTSGRRSYRSGEALRLPCFSVDSKDRTGTAFGTSWACCAAACSALARNAACCVIRCWACSSAWACCALTAAACIATISSGFRSAAGTAAACLRRSAGRAVGGTASCCALGLLSCLSAGCSASGAAAMVSTAPPPTFPESWNSRTACRSGWFGSRSSQRTSFLLHFGQVPLEIKTLRMQGSQKLVWQHPMITASVTSFSHRAHCSSFGTTAACAAFSVAASFSKVLSSAIATPTVPSGSTRPPSSTWASRSSGMPTGALTFATSNVGSPFVGQSLIQCPAWWHRWQTYPGGGGPSRGARWPRPIPPIPPPRPRPRPRELPTSRAQPSAVSATSSAIAAASSSPSPYRSPPKSSVRAGAAAGGAPAAVPEEAGGPPGAPSWPLTTGAARNLGTRRTSTAALRCRRWPSSVYSWLVSGSLSASSAASPPPPRSAIAALASATLRKNPGVQPSAPGGRGGRGPRAGPRGGAGAEGGGAGSGRGTPGGGGGWRLQHPQRPGGGCPGVKGPGQGVPFTPWGARALEPSSPRARRGGGGARRGGGAHPRR